MPLPLSRLSAIALTLSALAAACAQTPNSSAAAALGQPVTLLPNTVVHWPSAKLRIQFAGVVEDSRCPAGVACIWAGQAKVRLNVHDAAAIVAVEILEGGQLTFGGYRLSLLQVLPAAPIAGQKTSALDYSVKVQVDPAGPSDAPR
jgi:hypothetical protein